MSLETSTVSADVSIHSNSDYSGVGFLIPFLKQSQAITSDVTILNYDEWPAGANYHFLDIDIDESSTFGNYSPYNGSAYLGKWSGNSIFRLNTTTDQLTQWDVPVSNTGSMVGIKVNATGFPFFAAGQSGSNDYIGMLNPITEEITLWGPNEFDSNGLQIDPVTNTIWQVDQENAAKFYSFNPTTGQLKTWNVESICGTNSAANSFGGLVLDTANNLVYGSDHASEFNICSLNYLTNAVTLYDTGISMLGNVHRPGIDSNGNVFLTSNHGGKPIMVKINPNVPEATTWTLTGLCCAWQTFVDQNNDIWAPTFYDLTSSTFDDGLVRLNQTTNLVTQWDFNYIGEGIRSTMTIDAKGDLWVNYDGSSGSANDHILHFFE